MSLSVNPKALRFHRERACLSRERVAVDVGRGYITVTSWEAGRFVPPVDILAKLADMYGVGIEAFFTDTGQPVGAA